jgi:hypothetical protein
MNSSFDIISEKKKQEYLFFEKVNPQNRYIVKNLIEEFDSRNSLLKIIRENKSNYEKIKMAYRKYLIERDSYISELISNL